MKRVLVCTIARDVAPHVSEWYRLLWMLRQHVGNEYAFEISVVENDSKDDTARWMRDLQIDAQRFPSGFGAFHLSTDTLGTQRYGSVWNVDRLRNLAAARQKCLDQAGDLSRFDKIAYVEPDVTYDPAWCAELILARHPRAAGLGEPDIYSGWSLRPESNPKESTFLYDVCATRATRNDVCWDVNENCGRWRGDTVIPTDLGGMDGMCLHPVWSTFNCFAVYNARPFREGMRWGYVNHRLSTGQQRVEDEYGLGWLDADTAVMCERFHVHGFNKIYVNTNCLVRHC